MSDVVGFSPDKAKTAVDIDFLFSIIPALFSSLTLNSRGVCQCDNVTFTTQA